MINKNKNNSIYINAITGKSTRYKYRFKTKEEFIKQYGENWKRRLIYRWSADGSMDYLHGTNMETKHTNFTGYKYTHYHGWYISPDMVVRNIDCNFKNLYFRKKLVYE